MLLAVHAFSPLPDAHYQPKACGQTHCCQPTWAGAGLCSISKLCCLLMVVSQPAQMLTKHLHYQWPPRPLCEPRKHTLLGPLIEMLYLLLGSNRLERSYINDPLATASQEEGLRLLTI